MSDHPLELLHAVRERREHRLQRELAAQRRAESDPRNAVFSAQSTLEGERARRQAYAAQWGVQASATSRVADQMASRACLQRMDADVLLRAAILQEAEAVLERAVAVTAACAATWARARLATEKNKHGAERYRQVLQRERNEIEESDLDDETDVQVMTKFVRAQR